MNIVQDKISKRNAKPKLHIQDVIRVHKKTLKRCKSELIKKWYFKDACIIYHLKGNLKREFTIYFIPIIFL